MSARYLRLQSTKTLCRVGRQTRQWLRAIHCHFLIKQLSVRMPERNPTKPLSMPGKDPVPYESHTIKLFPSNSRMIQNGGAFFDCGESKYAFQNFNFAVSIRGRILLTPKFPVSVEDSMQMHPMRTALCRSGYLNTDALHLISPHAQAWPQVNGSKPKM